MEQLLEEDAEPDGEHGDNGGPSLSKATMEDILRSGTHKRPRQDSPRVSDALMALLRLHSAFPSASSVMAVAALCTSLALWLSLAFAFPRLPGALTLLEAAVAEEHRARFEALTLTGSTCCMTSFFLLLMTLLGSFGLQRERSLVHAAGFLLCTLCFHGALLQGAQWIYVTPSGRLVSVARLVAVVHVSPLIAFLNCKLHHHGRFTPLTVGAMSALYGLLFGSSHLAPPPWDWYIFIVGILTSLISCALQIRFTLALPQRRGHSSGAAVLLASQIAGMYCLHPAIVICGRTGLLSSTGELLVNMLLEIGATMAHTAMHMFAIPGDPGQSESSSAWVTREMQHFVGVTDLRVAADLGQQFTATLCNDVEAPLEALGALVTTLHRADGSGAASSDVAIMLQNCSRTLRRVRDAAAVCQVSQHAARLDYRKCQLLPLCKRALEIAQKEGSCGRVQFDDSLLVQPPLLVDAAHVLRLFTALFATMGGAAATTHETSSSQVEWVGGDGGAVAGNLSASLDVSHQTHMLVVLSVPPHALGQASHASTWTATHTDLSTVKAVVAAHGGATKVHVDDAGGVAFHLTLPVHTHGELSSSAKARSRTLKHGVRGWYAESGTYVAGATEVPQVPGTEGTGSDASGETTFGWSPSGLDRTSVSILGSELLGVPGTATLQPGTSVFSTVTDECPSVVCAASDEAVLRAMEEASATCGTTAELLQSAADLQALLARWPHARCVLVLLWGLADSPSGSLALLDQIKASHPGVRTLLLMPQQDAVTMSALLRVTDDVILPPFTAQYLGARLRQLVTASTNQPSTHSDLARLSADQQRGRGASITAPAAITAHVTSGRRWEVAAAVVAVLTLRDTDGAEPRGDSRMHSFGRRAEHSMGESAAEPGSPALATAALQWRAWFQMCTQVCAAKNLYLIEGLANTVVILGRPHDPEASKLVVDACATLLAWSKRIGALVTQDGSRPLAAKALCAVHRGALRLQRDSLTTQLQDPPTLIATGPAMRQLRLQLARAEPGLLMASQGMRRAARAAGHGALLHGASRPTPGHAALQDALIDLAQPDLSPAQMAVVLMSQLEPEALMEYITARGRAGGGAKGAEALAKSRAVVGRDARQQAIALHKQVYFLAGVLRDSQSAATGVWAALQPHESRMWPFANFQLRRLTV